MCITSGESNFVHMHKNTNIAGVDYLKTASHVSCLEPLSLHPEVRSNSCTTSGDRRSLLKSSAFFWKHKEQIAVKVYNLDSSY